MKQVSLAFALLLQFIFGQSQVKFPPLDKSPMDMSYYPCDYPLLKIQDKASEPLLARVIYGRPQKNGRMIFGDLAPFGKVWRLGANEATELEFFADVKLAGNKIKKGRYSLYAIPHADKWTMVLNKETDTWGAFKYDSSKDILRVDIPVQKQSEINETLTMVFENDGLKKANLVMAWDDELAKMPFSW
jgi:Protein of unknown function (DUF2911)